MSEIEDMPQVGSRTLYPVVLPTILETSERKMQ